MEWEVWEIGGQRILADAPPVSGRSRGAKESSWLCFESATQRRWLSRYPKWWHAMRPQELEALCAAAQPEPPTSHYTVLPHEPTPTAKEG
jgi:hypothetical protein